MTPDQPPDPDEDMRDVLEAIDLSGSRDKAALLEAAVADLEPGRFGYTLGRVMAAQHHLMRHDTVQARRLLEEAGRGLPGELVGDVRVDWIECELAEGDDEAATRRLAELRAAWRAGELKALDCYRVADALRSPYVGGAVPERRKTALRWLTFPLTYLDPEVDEPDLDEEMCLIARYHLRREAGLAADGYDRLALELVEADDLP